MCIVLFIAIPYNARACFHFVAYLVLQLNEMDVILTRYATRSNDLYLMIYSLHIAFISCFISSYIAKRYNSDWVFVSFQTSFLKKRVWWWFDFDFSSFTILKNIWWVNPVKSIVWKFWYKYSKITIYSITIDARLWQQTFKCLLENLKMVTAYTPFFHSLYTQYKRISIKKNF